MFSIKKTIFFELKLTDPFFVELQEKVLDLNGMSDFSQFIQSSIAPVMNATLKSLKELSSKQKQDTSGLIQFLYEYNENIYPDFHDELTENIDKALKRRIHPTTLERITDIIEDFMNEYADRPKPNLAKKSGNTINEQVNSNLVNPDNELKSITNYITKTWDGFTDEKTNAFFKTVWDTANDLLKNNYDPYLLAEFRDSLKKMRDLPEFKINGISSKDFPIYFMLSNSSFKEKIMKDWDYESVVDNIVLQVKKDFPFASKARPKNYKTMAKDYRDYQGMAELNGKKLKQLFGGMHSGTASSHSFEIRTALPHVMYDDKCQGRKPITTLVGAMVGHAYLMNENNNGYKMLEEWLDLKNKIDNNPGQDIYFEFKMPLNQALFHVIKNEGDITPEALEILGIIDNKKKLKR